VLVSAQWLATDAVHHMCCNCVQFAKQQDSGSVVLKTLASKHLTKRGTVGSKKHAVRRTNSSSWIALRVRAVKRAYRRMVVWNTIKRCDRQLRRAGVPMITDSVAVRTAVCKT
jgi:hypothetical protein